MKPAFYVNAVGFRGQHIFDKDDWIFVDNSQVIRANDDLCACLVAGPIICAAFSPTGYDNAGGLAVLHDVRLYMTIMFTPFTADELKAWLEKNGYAEYKHQTALPSLVVGVLKQNTSYEHLVRSQVLHLVGKLMARISDNMAARDVLNTLCSCCIIPPNLWDYNVTTTLLYTGFVYKIGDTPALAYEDRNTWHEV